MRDGNSASCTLSELLAFILADAPRPVVLIDGGAGSGKTTLGQAMAAAWPGDVRVSLVSLDDFYPGWGGLAAASELVTTDVLSPSHPGYRRWDWARSAPAEWVPLSSEAPLIIEGCGTLTPASRSLATFGIWCELDATTRRHRAWERDGASFAAHWDEWAAQEATHWQVHRPWELADAIVDGPSLRQGPPGSFTMAPGPRGPGLRSSVGRAPAL